MVRIHQVVTKWANLKSLLFCLHLCDTESSTQLLHLNELIYHKWLAFFNDESMKWASFATLSFSISFQFCLTIGITGSQWTMCSEWLVVNTTMRCEPVMPIVRQNQKEMENGDVADETHSVHFIDSSFKRVNRL